MTHQDHVRLIQNGVTRGGIWADFGSGEGAFILALRNTAGSEINLYSVDMDTPRKKSWFYFL